MRAIVLVACAFALCILLSRNLLGQGVEDGPSEHAQHLRDVVQEKVAEHSQGAYIASEAPKPQPSPPTSLTTPAPAPVVTPDTPAPAPVVTPSEKPATSAAQGEGQIKVDVSSYLDTRGIRPPPFVQTFPSITTPPYVVAKDSEKPDWCSSTIPGGSPREGELSQAKLDEVATFISTFISDRDCSRDSQVAFAHGVKPESSFAAALYYLASTAEIKYVLEVGTFRGCGSTLVLAKAALDSGGCVATLEADPEYKRKAEKNLAGLPVSVFLGCGGGKETSGPYGIVPSKASDDLLKMTAGPDFQPSAPPEWKNWWNGEKDLCEKTQASIHNKNVYEDLCKEYDFSMGLFDGGEFHGDGEFWGAMEFCHSMKYVGFDDVNAQKYWRLYHQMLASEQWEELYSSFKMKAAGTPSTDKELRQGWAIFK
eukprot:CAMPEP_0182456024 /NCGR_PEP_ID=MMETSP1319-20130603/1996_1 /TAXON_ID=172717 /ORGANISM="Bolidomonas pacifica, Strain RCC208" /LENGTH=423 /DNA_ID=CAMNT_0024654199 /DNA_START=297 /DNA_END=1565 /DNA_ORIENTATION=-